MNSKRTVALLVTVALIVLAGLLLAGPWALLQERLRETSLRAEARGVTDERTLDLSNLSWAADQTPYVPPAKSRRDEVTETYRRALVELSYALYTGDTSGLPTYFALAALDDAVRSATSGDRQRFVTWDHLLTLHFYAPQGNAAAFADSYCYAQWAEPTAQPLAGRRNVDVVMRLGDDGLWRLHQWQVVVDVPRDLPPDHDRPETARLRPCRP